MVSGKITQIYVLGEKPTTALLFWKSGPRDRDQQRHHDDQVTFFSSSNYNPFNFRFEDKDFADLDIEQVPCCG